MKALRMVLAVFPLAVAACASCGTPPMPKGPPPEYEEPPAPSWLEAGAPPAAPAAPAAGSSSPAPQPTGDGGGPGGN